jgi:hypothetical protein
LEHGFTETVFADDLNCYKSFSSTASDNAILGEMRDCQASLHDWGNANQVAFDPAKETFHILHRARPLGSDFKILGVTFDAKLLMEAATCEIAAQAHTRLNSILRARRFYPVGMVIWLYKSLVLSYVEVSTPAIYHATDFAISSLDNVQDRFLLEMELSEETALCEFALAPLVSRRDIAMMGLIHKVVLGLAPVQFSKYFWRAPSAQFPRGLRAPHLRHDRQLHDPIDGSQCNMYCRSVFKLIYSYKLLPQLVVESKTVCSFQGTLQKALRHASDMGIREWPRLLSQGARDLSVDRFQACFRR